MSNNINFKYRIKIETQSNGNILYTPQVRINGNILYYIKWGNINENHCNQVEISFTMKSSYYREEDALILIEKHKLQNKRIEDKTIIETTFKEIDDEQQ
jgi:hypothetical protein